MGERGALVTEAAKGGRGLIRTVERCRLPRAAEAPSLAEGCQGQLSVAKGGQALPRCRQALPRTGKDCRALPKTDETAERRRASQRAGEERPQHARAMGPVVERPAEAGTSSAAAELELLKRRAAERIDEAAERLGALSRAIWSAPELAYEEHRAHGELTRFFERELPAASWAVQPHFGLPTAFRAEWAPPEAAAGPRALQLAFLCEYDALPALGHACGHNLIAEVGAAAALGLRAALESSAAPPPVKVSLARPAGCA